GGRSAIPAEPTLAVAREGVDDSSRTDHAHAVVCKVGDVELSAAIERQVTWKVQVGGSGRATIAPITACAVPRIGVDDSGSVYNPNHTVRRVGDVEIAGLVVSHRNRVVECGLRGWPTIAGVAGRAGTGDRRDDPARGNLAYPFVA